MTKSRKVDEFSREREENWISKKLTESEVMDRKLDFMTHIYRGGQGKLWMIKRTIQCWLKQTNEKNNTDDRVRSERVKSLNSFGVVSWTQLKNISVKSYQREILSKAINTQGNLPIQHISFSFVTRVTSKIIHIGSSSRWVGILQWSKCKVMRFMVF